MQAAAKDLNKIRVTATDMRTDYSSGDARSLLDDADFDAFRPEAVALPDLQIGLPQRRKAQRGQRNKVSIYDLATFSLCVFAPLRETLTMNATDFGPCRPMLVARKEVRLHARRRK
jgi:hypothetical protein